MRGTLTELQRRVLMFVQIVMVALFVSSSLLGLYRFAQIHGLVEWPEIDIIHQQRRDIKLLEARIDQLHEIIGVRQATDILPDNPGPVDRPLVEPKPFH
jgi:hypothetical protein